MRYLFTQHQGNTTVLFILENPLVEDGIVYATIVGNFAGWSKDDDSKYVFESCPPRSFIAGGGPWIMTGYTDQLM